MAFAKNDGKWSYIITPWILISNRAGHMAKKRVSDIAKFIIKYWVGVSLEPQSITVKTLMFARIPIKDMRDHTIVINNKSGWLIIAEFSLS